MTDDLPLVQIGNWKVMPSDNQTINRVWRGIVLAIALFTTGAIVLGLSALIS